METITKTANELRRGLLAERVARGVALFDREMPGWWRADRKPSAINTDRLDMGEGGWCVFGQLENPGTECAYTDMAVRILGPDWLFREQEYGVYSDHSRDYPILTDLWREVIEKRRADA
jgi:hypothetical protein